MALFLPSLQPTRMRASLFLNFFSTCDMKSGFFFPCLSTRSPTSESNFFVALISGMFTLPTIRSSSASALLRTSSQVYPWSRSTLVSSWFAIAFSGKASTVFAMNSGTGHDSGPSGTGS